jgi:hypothetical protein
MKCRHEERLLTLRLRFLRLSVVGHLRRRDPTGPLSEELRELVAGDATANEQAVAVGLDGEVGPLHPHRDSTFLYFVGQEVDGMDGGPVSEVLFEQLEEGFDGKRPEREERPAQLGWEPLSGLTQRDDRGASMKLPRTRTVRGAKGRRMRVSSVASRSAREWLAAGSYRRSVAVVRA